MTRSEDGAMRIQKGHMLLVKISIRSSQLICYPGNMNQCVAFSRLLLQKLISVLTIKAKFQNSHEMVQTAISLSFIKAGLSRVFTT